MAGWKASGTEKHPKKKFACGGLKTSKKKSPALNEWGEVQHTDSWGFCENVSEISITCFFVSNFRNLKSGFCEKIKTCVNFHLNDHFLSEKVEICQGCSCVRDLVVTCVSLSKTVGRWMWLHWALGYAVRRERENLTAGSRFENTSHLDSGFRTPNPQTPPNPPRKPLRSLPEAPSPDTFVPGEIS